MMAAGGRMNIAVRSIAAFFVFALAVSAQDRFFSLEQQKKMLVFKDNQEPARPQCPAGEDVPLAVVVSPAGKLARDPKLWSKTKKGWLHQKQATTAIKQAIAYLKQATLRVTGKESFTTVFRIPCGSQ